MLRLETFTFNAFQENTYLIINDKNECWIVDPGMYDKNETNHLFKFIEDKALEPQAVLNTHAHIDHIFGVSACKRQFGIPFLMNKKELPVLNVATASAMMYGFDFNNAPEADGFIEDSCRMMLGEDEIEVRFTPGHSPGSIVFYYEKGKWLIGGDVLFNGSIGRTDLPGGDFDTLINSIRTQVLVLPEDTTVYPGHGPETTVGTEGATNPFLQDI